MTKLDKVYITGLSALSASGTTAEENWASVLAGNTALDTITGWDISSWTHQMGGEIKQFKPEHSLPDRKLIKVISRQDVLGIYAAVKAVEHSQLLSHREVLDEQSLIDFNESTAVYVGSPGNKYYQQYDFLPLLAKTGGDMTHFAEELFGEVHPMWLLRILPNNVLAYTGITYGFKGANHNITNHVVSGMQAIIEAYHAIQQGQAERAVVVAYDVGIEPQALYYYEKLGLTSTRHLKPFDKTHDGTLLADGAAALVLESETSVRARNATCYAEVLTGRTTTEAAGLFSVAHDGEPLATLLSDTLTQSQLNPSDVGMVVAHGNGNPASDLSEAQAIQTVFGDYAVPITALKWAMGHTLCASGVLETVLTTLALRDQCIPGVAVLGELAPACSELNISANTRPIADNKNTALLINRGFGSMNAILAIKACE